MRISVIVVPRLLDGAGSGFKLHRVPLIVFDPRHPHAHSDRRLRSSIAAFAGSQIDARAQAVAARRTTPDPVAERGNLGKVLSPPRRLPHSPAFAILKRSVDERPSTCLSLLNASDGLLGPSERLNASQRPIRAPSDQARFAN